MSEEWRRLANRTQNGWRAVGGRLTVRDRDLVFEPNAFDALLGGRRWQSPLSGITALRRHPGEVALGNLFSGGLVDRLELTLADGSVERFVTKDIDQAIGELTALRDAP